ncbi:hypothetical protein [Bradyrhizobium sp.]|uniref:hypothetical protein n=1 Tax=Bradyrhizobium sp. TaxID=376 RepID=UPI003C547EFE
MSVLDGCRFVALLPGKVPGFTPRPVVDENHMKQYRGNREFCGADCFAPHRDFFAAASVIKKNC